MTPLSAALVIVSRPLWEQTHTCLQTLPVRIALEQNEIDNVDDLLDRIERHRVDVVLIEASRLSLPLDEFVRRAHDTASQPAIFVLHQEAASQPILEALRAGAAEFLFPPLVDTLREALERCSAARSRQTNTQAGGLGRVFGFISVKGGCGATTVAAHVANDVARSLKQPTLLADFDFEAGLQRFLFKSKSTYSVTDAFDNMHRMDSSYWKALISTHANQLELIPAPDELAARRPPASAQVAQLVRFTRSVYQSVVIDFGRWYNHTAEDAMAELDSLFIVTTLDLEALEQARECVAALRAKGFGERLRLVVNRIPARGGADLKAVETMVGLPPAAGLTSDFEGLYEAWSEGRFLEPDTTLAKEIRRLSEQCLARFRGAKKEEIKAAEKNLMGSLRGWIPFLNRNEGRSR